MRLIWNVLPLSCNPTDAWHITESCSPYFGIVTVQTLRQHLWQDAAAKPIQHLPVMQLFTADIFVQSESNSCMRWWRWLPCKVLTSTSGAVWGSVSCPKTLADQGNPWATDTHNHHTHFFWAIHTSGGHRGTLECIGSHTSGLFGEYYHHHLHHIHIVSIVFFFF